MATNPEILRVRVEAAQTPLVSKALEILRRELLVRSNCQTAEVNEEPQLVLRISDAGGENGFVIDEEPEGVISISAQDDGGLLYGIGKFLHTSRYTRDSFSPSIWRGASVPDCSLRGIYFAHNFHNWHYSVPLAEAQQYLEELALWGMNVVAFNFPYLANYSDSEREKHLKRNRGLIEAAHACGMKVVLLYAPNNGFSSVPESIRCEPFPDAEPARRGNNPKFVCPSKPEGWQFLREKLSEDLDYYLGLEIDYIATFPYDAGGCGCEGCRPWGANGFVRLSRELIRLAKERFGSTKLILTTWCFDVLEEPEGEYEGLARILEKENDWCDVIMTDAHGDFPSYPLEHGVPGNLPMINFAEISMWGRYPWGGSGANPFPDRIQTIWRQASHLLDGGLPYSEGRFEDINKVCCLQLFWQKDACTRDIIKEYAAYEYGEQSVESVSTAVQLLEEIYPTADLDSGKAEEALELLRLVEQQMPDWASRSWRWRILYLRAVIDVETARDPDVVTRRRNEAYEELTDLYCAQKAGGPVAPRSASFYAREDIQLKGPVFAEHIGEHASEPDRIR